MKLDPVVEVKPGETVGLYVHSLAPGDQAIVYNNQFAAVTVEDRHFKVLPGFAHVSNRPFSENCAWGYAWRDGREFVGRLQYGLKWKLWKPEHHKHFPAPFKNMVMTLFLCHRRKSALLSKIPQTVLKYIINFCAWDWAGVPEELAISAEDENPADLIKARREEEYKNAVGLRDEGQRLFDSHNYTEAVQKFAEALAMLRGGITGKRSRLSSVLFSLLAHCCLQIADGNDNDVIEFVNTIPANRRAATIRSLQRQCLEQTYAYGIRALARADDDDTKLLSSNHCRIGVASLRLQSLDPRQREYYLLQAVKHFRMCLGIDSSNSRARTGLQEAEVALRQGETAEGSVPNAAIEGWGEVPMEEEENTRVNANEEKEGASSMDEEKEGRS
eukprot:CAMPEP_0170176148 /NCGR_PEP_ID=MMETSP0040_2-20121228/9092_1 /TAXON_ID=641309 /ORGANISM="Lotharella oceanica, Strain CCMP622" /LENGTH=386 /DNA_ID=CAMNT_0010418377 /DNA_START=1 /DNA_END=1161 /DNA_ORIENTATION=+